MSQVRFDRAVESNVSSHEIRISLYFMSFCSHSVYILRELMSFSICSFSIAILDSYDHIRSIFSGVIMALRELSIFILLIFRFSRAVSRSFAVVARSNSALYFSWISHIPRISIGRLRVSMRERVL